MIRSIAVTFIAPTQEQARAEADTLFAEVFGEGSYAVGGVELTPFEIGDLRPALGVKGEPLRNQQGDVVMVRDTLSWQGTFAAHPIVRR